MVILRTPFASNCEFPSKLQFLVQIMTPLSNVAKGDLVVVSVNGEDL